MTSPQFLPTPLVSPLEAAVDRSPLTLEWDTSVREAVGIIERENLAYVTVSRQGTRIAIATLWEMLQALGTDAPESISLQAIVREPLTIAEGGIYPPAFLLEQLGRKGLTHLGIANDRGTLTGVLSARDLLALETQGLSQWQVGAVMERQFVCQTREADRRRCLEKLQQAAVPCAALIDPRGQLLGQITPREIGCWWEEREPTLAPATAIDPNWSLEQARQQLQQTGSDYGVVCNASGGAIAVLGWEHLVQVFQEGSCPSLTPKQPQPETVSNSSIVNEIGNASEQPANLKQRLAFEQLLSTLARDLSGRSAIDLDRGIEQALATITAKAGYERSHIVVLSGDGKKGRIAYQWSQSGIGLLRQTDPSRSDVGARWLACLQEQDEIEAVSLNSLSDSDHRHHLLRLGTRSMFVISLKESDRLLGYLCFATLTCERVWPTPYRELVKVVAEIFTIALQRRQAQKQLQREQQRFEQTFEQAPVGLFHATLDGAIVHVNQTLCRLLGYSVGELVGKTTAEISHPDDLELCPRAVENLLAAKDSVRSYEKRLLHRQGHLVWVSVTLSLVRDMDGVPEYFIAVLEDISQRQSDRAALEHQLAFNQLIATCSTRLINLTPAATPPEIEAILGDIGRFMEVDVSSIFQFHEGGNSASLVYEWRASGMTPQGANLEQIPFTAYPWANEQLLRSEVVCICSLEELPETAVREKKQWQANRIQSILAIPLSYGGQRVGFISFAARNPRKHWSPSSIELLRVLGEAIINAWERQKTEMALRDSEQRWQLVLQGNNDGIWDWNVLTGEAEISDRYCEIIGYTPEAVNYQWWRDNIHPEDRERVLAELDTYLAGKIPIYVSEYRFRCGDGTYKWVLKRGRGIWDATGTPIRVVGSLADISDRVDASQRLALLAEFNQQVIDCAREGIVVFDREMRYRVWNRAMEEMTGVLATEVLGKRLDDLFPSLTANGLLECKQRVLAGETLAPADTYHEIPMTGRSLWTSEKIAPLRNGAGEIIGAIATIGDITSRKQIEQQLRHWQATLAEAQKLAEVGTWEYSIETNRFQFSPEFCQIFGLAAEAEVGFPGVLERLYAEDRDRFEMAVRQAIEQETSHESDYRIWCNGCRWITARVASIPGKDGRTSRILGTVLDISKRKAVEAALRQSQEQLRRSQRTLAEAQKLARLGNWQYEDLNFEFSEEFCQIFGFATDTAVDYASVLKRFHGEDRDRFELAVREAIEEGISDESDYRIWRDGWRWITARVAIYQGDEGNYKLLGTVFEITERKAAEAALLRSEARFRALSECSPIGIFTTDGDGRCSYANPRYREFCGGTDPANSLVLEFLPEQERQRLLSALAAGAIAGEEFQWECRYHRSDGNLGWVEVRLAPLRLTESSGIAYVGTVEDITDRKAVEALLRTQTRVALAERAKLFTIVDRTPDFVGTATPDGQVSYLNNAALSLLGGGRESDFQGRAIAELHPQWAAEIIQQQGIPTAIERGVWVGETALLNSQGEEIPLSQLIICHRGEDGEIELFSTVARDIRPLKQAQAKMRASEQLWCTLIESINLLVVVVSARGTVQYVNPFFMKLTGYGETDAIASSWIDTFIAESDRQRVREHLAQALESGTSYYSEESIVTATGELRRVAWNGIVRRSPTGEGIGFIAIGTDITESEAVAQLKDEFISVVSHELRTPLTAIQSSLSVLIDGVVPLNSARGQQMLTVADNSTERLVRLVNDILQLERLKAGKLSLAYRTFRVSDLLQRTVELLQVLADKEEIVLETHLREDRNLYADEDRLQQVLTNLIGNAIKFSPPGSPITIGVEFGVEQVHFQVRDRGCGIPAEKLSTLFQPFVQVSDSDAKRKGGTGLGLAISRRLVEQHGGSIWVESTLNVGSTFYFSIPLIESKS